MQTDNERDGYKAGSSGYRHGCRCDDCKASNRKYQRKHRADDETTVTEQPTVTKPVTTIPVFETETAIAIPEMETLPAIPVRDNTVPFQIIDAVNSCGLGQVAIYEDTGEGWELNELASVLHGMADVTCEIHDEKLHLSAIIAEVVTDTPSPMTMLGPITITMPQRVSHHPAQPRVTPKAPMTTPARPRNVTRATAPPVPGTPYRAPVNTTRNANTSEPFSL